MKKRKGYKTITVGKSTYQYAVSLSAKKVFVYTSKGKRIEVPFSGVSRNGVWHGKYGDAGWGKFEVSQLIGKWEALQS